MHFAICGVSQQKENHMTKKKKAFVVWPSKNISWSLPQKKISNSFFLEEKISKNFSMNKKRAINNEIGR